MSEKSIFVRAHGSAVETYLGCMWVFDELITAYAKQKIRYALTFLFAASAAAMALPYAMKYVIDAYSKGDARTAVFILLLVGGLAILQTMLASAHDFFRERAWNDNFRTVKERLVAKMYNRTLDEIVAEDSEVGAEQIESLKDEVRHILWILIFELPIVLLTIITSTAFLYLSDIFAGVVFSALTAFNILWFYFMNTSLSEKVEPIDLAFRRSTRRIVERLNLVASVKTAGVEEKMVKDVGIELEEPLRQDFVVWGLWFIPIDSVRRCINALSPALVLLYGVLYTDWSNGTLAAVATLAFLATSEYGNLGHLMRHLADHVVRIKATREALTKEPAFDYTKGIIYERKS